jgi:hypothetical protein
MIKTLYFLTFLFLLTLLPPVNVLHKRQLQLKNLQVAPCWTHFGTSCVPWAIHASPAIKPGLTFPHGHCLLPARSARSFLIFIQLDEVVPILSGPSGGETGQAFQPGFVYVSYIDRVESNGVYYMLQNGGWIPGKGSRIGEYSRFQGLQFKSTPRNAFAWPLPFYIDSIPVYRAPGYSAPLTDRIIYPYVDIVQVYATRNVDGVTGT